jgi:lipase chaperone LimK
LFFVFFFLAENSKLQSITAEKSLWYKLGQSQQQKKMMNARGLHSATFATYIQFKAEFMKLHSLNFKEVPHKH